LGIEGCVVFEDPKDNVHEFAHDGHDDDFSWFSIFFQGIAKFFEVGIGVFDRDGVHEEGGASL
jgi:hypothetical protein